MKNKILGKDIYFPFLIWDFDKDANRSLYLQWLLDQLTKSKNHTAPETIIVRLRIQDLSQL